MSNLFSVITTIQKPTDSVISLVYRLADYGGQLIVAGDSKGPADYNIGIKGARSQFLSLEAQLASPFNLARLLPTGHYARKNIGYLHAIAQGASCIYETDDDNAPMAGWAPRDEYIADARIVKSDSAFGKPERWVNVYRYFSDENIWPRGLPLNVISEPLPSIRPVDKNLLWAPIQQGLANGSPDVDAIWRLVLDREFTFEEQASVYLEQGNWCPFNTQSTWWWPAAYPLLYIPSNCSFRMCDIWKSFIAQRCLWAIGAGVVFHAPEVYQLRNEHNLMRDFRDEVPGYLGNQELTDVLSGLELEQGVHAVARNLERCYKALVAAGFFPDAELSLLQAWLADLDAIQPGATPAASHA